MKSDAVFALENAGWPSLLIDGAGVIFRANAAAVKLFGSSVESGKAPFSSIWSPDNNSTVEQFLEHSQQAPPPTTSLKFRLADGSTKTFSTLICPFSGDGEKAFLFQLLPDAAPAGESNLAQKQKLDCALQLARTVSLDFNNALTSILGHTSLVLGQMEPNHQWRRSLLEVEKSAGRAAEIANDLGMFSRQEKEARPQAAGNLNSILQRAVETFQSGDKKVSWTLQLERKLFSAKFDEAKMQQAFMKILENAVQAVGDNGRVTVQTRNVELTEAAQDREVRLAPGIYVCIEISDNGIGIAPEVLPRIFEPFFTTKGAPHRGLGLAWVYGIVTNHGGGVAVSSQPGAGTSVRVYLPADKKVVHDHNLSAADLKGAQTILMVDDEDLLLTMGQTVLSAFGYNVLTANSGQKALEMLSKSGNKVDLVITDLVMPAMSGRELVEHLRKLSPQIRVLCTSGYVRPANQTEDAFYLQKPFTSQELLVKVKQVLANSGASSVD